MHRQITLVCATTFAVVILTACERTVALDDVYDTELERFAVETVAEDLENPWSLAFLPDGRMLVTERPGRLRVIETDGEVGQPLAGLPDIVEIGQGGLLDVALDPKFEDNKQIYLSYSGRQDGVLSTHVARAELAEASIENVDVIFQAKIEGSGGRHFGSRLVFDAADSLLITHGDRGSRENGQNRQTHAGAILRVATDGSVPDDNPFVRRSDTLPEIYTLGHRNPQGMTVHPGTGAIWSHEHGPRGGDEVNIIDAGANYGWPVASHGSEYVSGRPVSDTVSRPGMADPVWVWIPSIAPSGMTFYSADQFPAWEGDLFVGALAGAALVRLDVDGETVLSEERMLEGDLGRIRDVRQGPDGLLYLLVDDAEGGVYRLVPA